MFNSFRAVTIFMLGMVLSIFSLQSYAQDDDQWQINFATQSSLLNTQSRLQLSHEAASQDYVIDELFPIFNSLTAISPEMSGIRGQASIIRRDQGDITGTSRFFSLQESNTSVQLQARASYSNSFEHGDVNLWLGALWQEKETTSKIRGLRSDNASFGYNLGVDFNYAAFNLMGSYYDGEALDILYFNPYSSIKGSMCVSLSCEHLKKEGYIVSGAYNFTDSTKLGISYGESSQALLSASVTEMNNELWSVGLYHDVNSWLKFVAEYSSFKSSNYSYDEDSRLSVGGAIRW